MENFSLVFEGPRAAHFEQQTVTLENGALGTLELFLVPFGKPTGNVARYQAIFNIFSNS